MVLKRVAPALLAALLLVGMAPASRAALLNGGFEAGFTSWTTIGDASIQTQASSGTTPTEGVNQAMVTNINSANGVDGPSASGTNAVPVTGAGNLESFLGLAGGSLSSVGNGTATEGSGFKQTFTALAGDTLAFDWKFLTDDTAPTGFNDFGFFTLDGAVTKLTDVNSAALGAGNVFFNSATGYATSSLTLTAGSHTLGYGVVDAGDNLVNSGLMVDNVRQTPAVVVGGATPEPGTIAMMATGIAGLLASRRRRASRTT